MVFSLPCLVSALVLWADISHTLPEEFLPTIMDFAMWIGIFFGILFVPVALLAAVANVFRPSVKWGTKLLGLGIASAGGWGWYWATTLMLKHM